MWSDRRTGAPSVLLAKRATAGRYQRPAATCHKRTGSGRVMPDAIPTKKLNGSAWPVQHHQEE